MIIFLNLTHEPSWWWRFSSHLEAIAIQKIQLLPLHNNIICPSIVCISYLLSVKVMVYCIETYFLLTHMVYNLYIIDILQYTFILLTYGLQCIKIQKFLHNVINIMVIYFTTSWVGQTATQLIKIDPIGAIIPKFYYLIKVTLHVLLVMIFKIQFKSNTIV